MMLQYKVEMVVINYVLSVSRYQPLHLLSTVVKLIADDAVSIFPSPVKGKYLYCVNRENEVNYFFQLYLFF